MTAPLLQLDALTRTFGGLRAVDSVDFSLPEGDVLIVAGDLCNASALAPNARGRYAATQRERVLRFRDLAVDNFSRVLMVVGNHEHFDGVFEETVPLLAEHLDGFELLDDSAVEIGGVHVFGTTLWSDFEGRDPACMEHVRRGIGDYFFIKSRAASPVGSRNPRAPSRNSYHPEVHGSAANHAEGAAVDLRRLTPEDTLAAHDRARRRLAEHLGGAGAAPTVVVSHHAPSLKGLNPLFAGNGLDGAYASALDGMIAALETVPVWVHGHTHIRRKYRIGATRVCVNCRGFDDRDRHAQPFTAATCFDV